MNRHIILTALITLTCWLNVSANINATWKEINASHIPSKGEQQLHPDAYRIYLLNDAYMKNVLFNLPEQPEQGAVITLPVADGSMMDFRIWQTPVMAEKLAAKYPGIKNFTAVAIDNPAITARVNYTYKGFNAMVYNDRSTYLIDPYSNVNDGYYLCYYKKDYPKTQHGFSCGTLDKDELNKDDKLTINNEPPTVAWKTYGSVKRTYRLALSCTGEYAKAVDGPNPTKPGVISAMATSLARVNGILAKDLNVNLQLVNNNDQLVYLDSATDPFSVTQNKIVNGSTQTANQTNIDNVIGTLNYDIGHVFCSGDGGIADLAGLCDPGHEARAATGRPNPKGDAFDVDYVVHEIGHQLGAEHTFNYNGSGCNPHARMACAYEPGSGSTIMAYAGLCSGNDIQFFSDDYFHAKSLDQITTYISGLVLCGSTTPSSNTPPSVADINATYEVPKLTPFELEAPLANDPENGTPTYCWEEYDLGDFGSGLAATKYGPIFRSFLPETTRWRVFPKLDSIRRNVLDYPGEKLPEVTRTMNFRLTVRDMFNGEGAYNWSDNTVKLNVTDQAGPFLVQQPNASTDYWRIGNSYTVKWDVANTNTSPVSCANVDIFLSLDDGQTYPYTLATNTPNDGSEVITVPANTYTASARVKIKGSGNVFFDISNESFVINHWPDSINDIQGIGRIELFPVPAKNTLHVSLIDGGVYQTQITNSLGQVVWNGKIDRSTSVNLGGFASGVYHFIFVSSNGDKAVKKFVVE